MPVFYDRLSVNDSSRRRQGLLLEAVEDVDEKVFAFDGLARAVVEGDDHRGFVGGAPRSGLLRRGLRSSSPFFSAYFLPYQTLLKTQSLAGLFLFLGTLPRIWLGVSHGVLQSSD